MKLRSSQVRAARTRMVGVGLALCVGTVVALFALWWVAQWTLNRLVYENKSFNIQHVEVETDGIISSEQLRRWSGVKSGENLLALDLARVKRNLEMVPVIQSVSVERVLPGTLRLRVVERDPVAQVTVPRLRAGGGFEFIPFQMDADGYVMAPLDPRQTRTSTGLTETNDPLPLIAGIDLSQVQPGRRIETVPAQAALKFLAEFESSPMAGLVDLRRIDLSSPRVLVVTTAQGSEVTFGLENFEGQLLRWWKVHEECSKLNRTIATLDVAVGDYTPLRLVDTTAVPPSAPKNAKPPRTRKKNV